MSSIPGNRPGLLEGKSGPLGWILELIWKSEGSRVKRTLRDVLHLKA